MCVHAVVFPIIRGVCLPKFLNFALVPLYVRTAFTGCCAFIWATFLCFSRQTGDGTAGAALAWMFPPKEDAAEPSKKEEDSKLKVEEAAASRAVK